MQGKCFIVFQRKLAKLRQHSGNVYAHNYVNLAKMSKFVLIVRMRRLHKKLHDLIPCQLSLRILFCEHVWLTMSISMHPSSSNVLLSYLVKPTERCSRCTICVHRRLLTKCAETIMIMHNALQLGIPVFLFTM